MTQLSLSWPALGPVTASPWLLLMLVGASWLLAQILARIYAFYDYCRRLRCFPQPPKQNWFWGHMGLVSVAAEEVWGAGVGGFPRGQEGDRGLGVGVWAGVWDGRGVSKVQGTPLSSLPHYIYFSPHHIPRPFFFPFSVPDWLWATFLPVLAAVTQPSRLGGGSRSRDSALPELSSCSFHL